MKRSEKHKNSRIWNAYKYVPVQLYSHDEMDAILSKLYYNPSKGYSGIDTLLRQARLIDSKIQKHDILTGHLNNLRTQYINLLGKNLQETK